MKLKEIKGLLVEKCPKREPDEYETDYADGFDEAIDLMGEREITLNREKLAKILYKDATGYMWDECEADDYRKQLAYDTADSILSSLPEILEVEK